MRIGKWWVTVADEDGQAVKVFSRDGKPEIWLVAVHDDSLQHLVGCMEFSSIDHADRAATVLYKAIREVEQIACSLPATQRDGHEHRIRPVRYSRSLAKRGRCELCDVDLGEIPHFKNPA